MSYRLPTHIIPVKYIIRIITEKPLYNKFIGKCIIIFKILDPNLNYIILNGKEIFISDVKLASITNDNITYHKHKLTTYIHDFEQIQFDFETMPNQMGALIIEYEGNISSKLNGLYKCMQDDKLIILTQFEPTYARLCFPCFDEPYFKAIFKLEIVAESDKLVLSNTDIESVVNYKDDKTHIFKETPIMSTYLVAFYIGHANYIENYTKDNIRIRIYSPKKKEYSELALEVAVKCMDFLTTYFNKPYPLNKLDLISVPKFSSDAMENWGLVTFREKTLLCEPFMSLNDRIYVIIVICHELAHQWFGNLVTMSWWDDLWLNESFASWAEYYIIKKLYPELNINNRFMYDRYVPALIADSIMTTHPIKCEVNTTSQINDIFSTITYSKGASIIKMLVTHIGEANFQKSMQLYIKKHAYKNATSDDLWNCINFITNENISNMMHSWINNKNFPLVIVNLYDSKHLKFTQSTFTYKNNESNNLWIVPLNHDVTLQNKHNIILKSKFKSKIDNNNFGFYNIFYCEEVFNELIQQKQLTDLDITNMLVDLYFFLKSNRITFNYYLEYINKILQISKQTELLYNIIQLIYNDFKMIIKNDIMIKKYEQLLVEHIKDINKIYVKDDDVNTRLMKISVLNLGTILNIESHVNYCIDLFNKFFDAYMNKKEYTTIIDVNIISTVFRVAIEKLDKFDFLFDLLHENENYEDYIISNLGLTQNKIKYIIFLDLFKIKNKSIIFKNAGSNKNLNYLLWPYIKDNWDLIFDTFNNIGKLDDIILSMGYLIGNINLVSDIEMFFKIKNKNGIEFAYNKLIEIIKINYEFNINLT